MNLTPEQRDIGKQNFNEAVGSDLNRREMMMGLAAGTIAAGSLGAMYFGYGAKVEEPLRIGIIGTGDEGSVLIGALNPEYLDVVAIADIRPYNQHRAFHGDQDNIGARPGLIKQYGYADETDARKHIKVYTGDYQELIDDPNVEAVIIALPLWLHDVAAFKAMRAGKHVLTEKLMGQTVSRCKEMGRLAEELKATNGDPIVFAVGHQRHYSVLYANAVDQIRRGLLGELHHIRAQWHRGNLPGNDSWCPPMPEAADYKYDVFDAAIVAAERAGDNKAKAQLVAAHPLYTKLRAAKGALKNAKGSDIDLQKAKLAQLEKQLEDINIDLDAGKVYGYVSKTLPNGNKRSALEELIRWRLWDRTGAGLMAELGSHQLDASSIFVSSQRDDGGKVYPIAVQGIGFRSLFPADRDVDDHVHCNFEFPGKNYYEDIQEQKEIKDPNSKIVVTYSSINGNGFGGYGEVVLGTGGTLVLDRETEVMLYKSGDANTKIQVNEGKGKAAMSTYETGGGPPVAAAAAATKNVSRGYKEEMEHWAWCIRNPSPQNQPKCGAKVAMADAIIALTSNIAMKQGKRIEFKKEWFDIHDDASPEVDLGVDGAADPRKTETLA